MITNTNNRCSELLSLPRKVVSPKYTNTERADKMMKGVKHRNYLASCLMNKWDRIDFSCSNLFFRHRRTSRSRKYLVAKKQSRTKASKLLPMKLELSPTNENQTRPFFETSIFSCWLRALKSKRLSVLVVFVRSLLISMLSELKVKKKFMSLEKKACANCGTVLMARKLYSSVRFQN
jgi:hypothetical protein